MTNLLSVEGLTKSYPVGTGAPWSRQRLRIVQDVEFTLDEGRTLALVGESGAGKSTTGRLVLRLLEADAGRVSFQGKDVFAMGRRELRALRRSMQIVFQDPYSAFDPRVRILESVAEPMLVHGVSDRSESMAHARQLLRRVGLGPEIETRFPREVSGGQLQRATIARALTVRPQLIVCDEPVAALDVSVRAQVVNLMLDLQAEFGLAYLFISHDLALVSAIADEVAVMQGGRIVERGSVEEIFANPEHPHTRELIDAMPRLPGEATAG
jgi:peptide/nickel transport system ATP-binding protein/oligopeptide transport system ATP-binding protein